MKPSCANVKRKRGKAMPNAVDFVLTDEEFKDLAYILYHKSVGATFQPPIAVRRYCALDERDKVKRYSILRRRG